LSTPPSHKPQSQCRRVRTRSPSDGSAAHWHRHCSMGQACSFTSAVEEVQAGSIPQTPWDEPRMTQALAAMETAVAAAKTKPLQPPQPFPPTPNAQFASRLSEWDFDLFTVPYDELPGIAYSALMMHPAISDSSSKFDHAKLWRYVCEIAAHYHPRPFHNFRHAVDVVLATSYLIRTVQRDHPAPFTDPIQVSALLISALVHDTDHPGVMNTYLIATQNPIAVKRGEAPKAVLEHHHAEMALALLERPELNFLEPLPEGDFTTFTELIRENVLNTDVTTTMGAAKQFSERRPSLSVIQFEDAARNSKTGTEHQAPTASQVMCLIIKAADISNPARPLNVYGRWIDGVMAEFFTQGDAERKRGMTISMNCDRNTVQVPKSQVGFITFLVMPLYRALCTYSPGVQHLVTQLEVNLKHFADLSEKEVMQPTQGSPQRA